MPYDPSLKIVHAILDPETRRALSFPVGLLIAGTLSQVEATIELTNRIYDSYFGSPSTLATGFGSGDGSRA